MNILIPHSWLKEYLDTPASPEKIGECLSLCGASVEKIDKVGKDFVYDIEITTNRVDMASVLGIAREATAILPQFDIKARLKKDPYDSKLKNQKSKLKITTQNAKLPLTIKDDNKLCQRVLGVVLKNVKLGPSPKKIQDRLNKAGIRSLNNAVDITNYIMTELGHPAHVFDYDRIKTKKLILRKAKKGEKIVSLEKKEYSLPGGDIVIDNGTGQIIDLPGIIGTENSVVKPETKRVILFLETNDPVQIRKSSMSLGIRTVAASLNEKGVDPQLAKITLLRGIQLFQQLTGAKVASPIYDFYPYPDKPKKVEVSLQLIKQYLGIDIKTDKVIKILDSLGFKTKLDARRLALTTEVPSWRVNDINIAQDLIEEIARLVGYHNLPSILPPLYQQPVKPNYDFSWENEVKKTLKNWGFTETYTYSLVSQKLISDFGLDPSQHLKIKNPLTEDMEYLRLDLLPSLLAVVKENQNLAKELKFFELAHVYLPRRRQLPEELLKLALIVPGDKFYQVKGVVEGLLQQLGINKLQFKITTLEPAWLEQASVYAQGRLLGQIGYLNPKLCANFEIKDKIAAAYLDFDQIANLATRVKKYHPLAKYPPIIEDLSFSLNPQTTFSQLRKTIKATDKLVHQIELVDTYKNNLTLRIFYLDPAKNLTDKKVAQVRKKIIIKVRQQDLGKLRGKVKGLD
jgi:phenylalanyl-tRNA synthetase beta chain